MGGKISIPQFDQNDRPYTKKQRKKLLNEALTNQKEHSNVARNITNAVESNAGVPEELLFETMRKVQAQQKQLEELGVVFSNVSTSMPPNPNVAEKIMKFSDNMSNISEQELNEIEDYVKIHGNGTQIEQFRNLKKTYEQQKPASPDVSADNANKVNEAEKANTGKKPKEKGKLWKKIKNIFVKKAKVETPQNVQAEKGVEANDTKSPEKPKEKGKFWNKIKNIFVKKAKVETPQNAQVKAEPNLNETPQNVQAEKGVEANDSKSPEKPKEKGKLWNKIKNIFTKKQKPASQNVEQAVQGATEESGKFKTFIKNISKRVKGKGGKAAIIVGIATATLFLFNISKRNNREEISIEEDSAGSNPNNVTDSSFDTENVTDTTVDEQDSTDDNASEETDESTVTDTSDTENEEEGTSVTNNSNTETVSMVDSSGNYTVKRGDCVWNIAKAYLTETLDRRPTNAEILAKTRRIMQRNNIELIDNYYARINPDDTLDLSA